MENVGYWSYENCQLKSIYSTNNNVDNNLLLRDEDDKFCNNLINLTYLNEPTVLNNILFRYSNDEIYTFNGDILIAINPFKKIPIYSNKIIKDYVNNDFDSLQPHPYYISKKAVKQLSFNSKDQSILVSGESGAGKTQTTKFILNYISNISNDNNELSNKILSSNPILEAFGNAKTIRNDNSSRFGKFIRVLFDKNNNLIGANIDTYLLEKIRVTHVESLERNFHIFYLMLKGLTKEKKENLLLTKISDYNYLNDANTERNDNVSDAVEMDNLLISFKQLNFNDECVNNIFKVISAILNLGNVETNIDIFNNVFFNNFCFLLDIPIQIATDFFCNKYIKIANETIKKEIKKDEFIILKDTFVQILYSLIFDFIVLKINNVLSNKGSNFIGILDIFGFEVFKNNGFEQLCINYTNEKLQNLFNKFIFEVEQKEYEKEEIDWKLIEYPNNSDVIYLFEQKSIGFFPLLVEQCILKQGSDKMFYNSLIKNIDNNNFEISNKNMMKNSFKIKHYADDVTYTCKDFIYKNRNQIDPRIKILINNGFDFLKNLNLKKVNLNSTNLKKNNIIYQFKNGLNNLLNNISVTKQHYIRCIKPNDMNIKNNFNNKRVVEQLKYCGIMEAIKISKAGYPVRTKINDFFYKFHACFISCNLTLKLNNINNLLFSFVKNDNDFQIGKTKVFMKNYLFNSLVFTNKNILNKQCTNIQKIWRCFYISKNYKLLLKQIINIQKKWRIKLLIKNISSKVITSFMKMSIHKKRFIQLKLFCTKIQGFFRVILSKNILINIKNAILIQSNWRSFCCRKSYIKNIFIHRKVIKIQKQWNAYKNRKKIFESLRQIKENNKASKKVEILSKEMKEKEDFIKKLIEENDKLKQKESNVVLEENIVIEDYAMTKMEEELKEKTKKIKELEKEKTRNKITKETHKEIADKMEKLYVKLYLAQRELAHEKEKQKCLIM